MLHAKFKLEIHSINYPVQVQICKLSLATAIYTSGWKWFVEIEIAGFSNESAVTGRYYSYIQAAGETSHGTVIQTGAFGEKSGVFRRQRREVQLSRPKNSSLGSTFLN
jgi:hypothetical protein